MTVTQLQTALKAQTALFAAVEMYVSSKSHRRDAAEILIDDAVSNILGGDVQIELIDANWGRVETTILTSLGMLSVRLNDRAITFDAYDDSEE